jgi:hypothetical protein
MIRLRDWRLWALMACMLMSMTARADGASGVLEQCLARAVAARPGIVTGWQEMSADNPADGYYVRILGKDGGLALTECRPSSTAPLEFTKKAGLIRAEMYDRVKVAEPAARAVAPGIFVPPVRIERMELSISLRGVPYYTYSLVLPGEYKATVDVDGVSGKPLNAKVQY